MNLKTVVLPLDTFFLLLFQFVSFSLSATPFEGRIVQVPKKREVHDTKAATTRKSELPTWTVLVFLEGRNNLHAFAQQDIKELLQIGSRESANVLVQHYRPYKPVQRFKVNKGRMEHEVCRDNSQGDIADNLLDAAKWAFTKYPAKRYALILWDHGLGICDPEWGRGTMVPHDLTTEYVLDNPRTHIPGITVPNTHLTINRGLLFNEIDRTYMSNQDMVRAFSRIKNEVMNGKKIDVVAMDACLMAMLEVGYQLRDFADYFVASEEVELANGYDYIGILTMLAKADLTPEEFATGIVQSFGIYQSKKTHLYTQSAVKMACMDGLKDNLNVILAEILMCKKYEESFIKNCIINARRRCLQFSKPMFVDLHSLYTELFNQLNNYKFPTETVLCQDFKDHLSSLKDALTIGLGLINQAIVSKVGGMYLKRAEGISIYFPCRNIESSYFLTDFSRDTLWLHFLQDTLRYH